MKRFLHFPFYLLLMICYGPLNVYANNTELFKLFDTFRVLLALNAVALLFYVVLYINVKDFEKAGALTLCLIFPQLLLDTATPIYFLAVFIGICGLLVLRKRECPSAISILLNVFSLGLSIGLAVQIVHSYLFVSNDADLDQAQARSFVNMPDIYHFVLDGYSSDAVLKQIYEFDNSGFSNSLRALGFKVFENSTTPYNQTLAVMASIFSNKAIIKSPDTGHQNASAYRKEWGRIAINGPVQQALHSAGYTMAYEDSGYPFFRYPKHAVFNAFSGSRAAFSLFESYYVSRLPLYSHCCSKALGQGVVNQLLDHNELLKKTLNSRFYRTIPQPRFYYSHSITPHPPFSITATGDFRDNVGSFTSIDDGSHSVRGNERLFEEYKAGYLEKLQFTNKHLLEALAHIVEQENGNKIIIVHGDHGGGSLFNHEDLKKTCSFERYSPYLAIYMSKPDLLDAISVNDPFSLLSIYGLVFAAMEDKAFYPSPTESYFISWQQPWSPAVFKKEQTCAGRKPM